MNSLELPPTLQAKPENRYKWDFPTAWLLGTRFVASLRDIVASAVFAVDPRDWMHPEKVIDLSEGNPSNEYWFDFLADSGDSPRLVYQLAYLLQQQSLVVDGCEEPLPQGKALVFGGDTAYPVATRRRLLERVRAPFIWASEDLEKARKLSSNRDIVLLGIPGNHDYYNALAGFERQFHVRDAEKEPDKTQQVELPGYVLKQQASYFAANLPGGWQLWGADIETHDVDGIQKRYFERAIKDKGFRGKRIVATSRPTFVNHGYSYEFDEIKRRFIQLGLGADHHGEKKLAVEVDGLLDSDAALLELSGDTHLYERYWGIDKPSSRTQPEQLHRPCPPSDRQDDASTTPERTNYASVVSGLGGAFHHPSQIRVRSKNHPGPVHTAPRCAWPGGRTSDAAIGTSLLRPRKLFQAGAVGVIGIAIASLTYPTDSSVLDIPFHLGASSWDWGAPAAHFLSVFAATVLVGLLCLSSYGCYKWGKHLHEQVRAMGEAKGGWGTATKFVSHNECVWWLIRWLGVSRRNLWGVLITSPSWLIGIAAWIAGVLSIERCSYLASCNDGSLRTYLLFSTLILLLATLGGWKWCSACGWWGGPAGALLGVYTGVLIAWTPYGWAQQVPHTTAQILTINTLWLLAFFTQFATRQLLTRVINIFHRSVRVRRVITFLALACVATAYVLVPVECATSSPSHSVWGWLLCAGFAAYLTCQWMGWYFFTSLQWNAHGNEAGGAARIVQYAEFLRIKLTETTAEVWAIGVQDAADDGVTPKACLIDHFSINAKKEGGREQSR